jgi:hypothetical protein
MVDTIISITPSSDAPDANPDAALKKEQFPYKVRQFPFYGYCDEEQA